MPPQPGSKDYRVQFRVELPKTARPGEVVKLTITGTPQGKFHTYPITRRTPDELKTMLSKVVFAESPGLTPLWPIEESETSFRKEDRSIYLVHENPFTWTQEILVQPGTGSAQRTLKFTIKYQGCDENCKWRTRRLNHDYHCGRTGSCASSGCQPYREQAACEAHLAACRYATFLFAAPVKLKVDVTPKQVKAGQTVKVTITGEPREGVLVFPVTRRAPAQPESELSSVGIETEDESAPLRRSMTRLGGIFKRSPTNPTSSLRIDSRGRKTY